MTRVLTPNLANYFFNRKRSSRFSGKIILTQELLTQANHQSVLCLVTHLGPTFWDPWTAAHQALLSMGILQARTLECVAMPSSTGSSQPRNRTQISSIAGEFFYQLSHQGSPRILQWVAYPFSRGSSQPRIRTRVSCIAGEFFTSWETREAQLSIKWFQICKDLENWPGKNSFWSS